jgi:hypothetical protein
MYFRLGNRYVQSHKQKRHTWVVLRVIATSVISLHVYFTLAAHPGFSQVNVDTKVCLYYILHVIYI